LTAISSAVRLVSSRFSISAMTSRMSPCAGRAPLGLG